MQTDTTMQAYQLNRGGSRARMAILRQMALASQRNTLPSTRLQSGDWKNARHYTMSTWTDAYIAGIHPGDAGKTWYTHGGEQFRNERDADSVLKNIGHTGWFTDTDGCETAVGIVASLPHGRFIAGYRWTANDERVYFAEVFDDEEDAARAADGHAESFADMSREDSERFDAKQDAEDHEREVMADVQMAYQARNVSPRHREHCRDRIEELREARADVERATEAYEKG